MDAERDLCWLLDMAAGLVPGEGPALVGAVRDVLGAQAGRVFVADYSLRRLQQVDVQARSVRRTRWPARSPAGRSPAVR